MFYVEFRIGISLEEWLLGVKISEAKRVCGGFSNALMIHVKVSYFLFLGAIKLE